MVRARPLVLLILVSAHLAGCEDHSVGGAADGALPDGAAPDGATLSCDPEPNQLGCVTIEFPGQQTAFTQAEAAAGIDFLWELSVPDPLDEVYPYPPNAGCCLLGASVLLAGESVTGNGQHYCECDHGPCDPVGCDDPPSVAVPAGRTTHVFSWPGVNWYGPSDTGLPYGPPFPRGEYVVFIRAQGQWRPPGGATLESYSVVGRLDIELTDGCGGRPAAEAALWDCVGGAGEGGFCVELEVDGAGQLVSWTPDWPLDPAAHDCLDDRLTNDCYLTLASTTESVCIYGP